MNASLPLAHPGFRPARSGDENCGAGVPTLSIVIPTLNRPGHALHTVRQLLEQEFGDFEVYVLDQSDMAVADKLRAGILALGDPRARHVRLLVIGLANARNEGIALSRGRIVLFLDDDVVLLGQNFLDAHLLVFQDHHIGGVTGRIIERRNRPNARRTIARVSIGGRTLDNMFGTEPVPLDGLKGGNMSLRAEIFKQIGGFDRNFAGTALLEDADFSTRAISAGWRLVFEPSAELLHLSAPSGGCRVGSDQSREWWRFRATAYYIRKHRGVLGMIPFLLTFSLIGIRKAIQWRTGGALVHLATGVAAGLRTLRQGTDEQLPIRKPIATAALSPDIRAQTGVIAGG